MGKSLGFSSCQTDGGAEKDREKESRKEKKKKKNVPGLYSCRHCSTSDADSTKE